MAIGDRKLTKHSVSNALRRCRTITAAAEMLGVTRRTVQRAIIRYGLNEHAKVLRCDAELSANVEVDTAASSIDEPKPASTVFSVDLSAFSGAFAGDVGGRRRH